MPKITKIFITGGMSSGKSDFAEKTAISIYKAFAGQDHADRRLHFIATAKSNFDGERLSVAGDEEMSLKIKQHKDKRDKVFTVHENFEDLAAEIKSICGYSCGADATACNDDGGAIILIDSMTMWLSSIFRNISDYAIALETVLKLAEYLAEIKCSVITVADSLAFNMVPVDAYARKFIKLNGLMEQELSALSDKAYCIIAGNPLILKDGNKKNGI
jgi:adenosyl cobinamide kinase/adenosyl cobinamide phosphate guanylyltransferase